ncbi:hypothetical protein AGLY_014651 [Aphis glycines]|uniref:Uncharacterized protein n=1 Tax=Aphis glycines TaxID=307491 RepID=A0A6G0T3V5_APHGL|nr:hypothetical protein AGLY_014651 [Aphis glycines]
MEVLISKYVVLMFDTANSICIDLDKRILLHIHDITYHIIIYKKVNKPVLNYELKIYQQFHFLIDVISVGLLYLEQFEFKLLSPDLKNITCNDGYELGPDIVKLLFKLFTKNINYYLYLSPANNVILDTVSFFESKMNASRHGIDGITCTLYVVSGTFGIFLRRQLDFTPNVYQLTQHFDN